MFKPWSARQDIYEQAVGLGTARNGVHWFQRVASQFGIEGRHPFMDRRLVEFIMSIPPELLYRGQGDRKLIPSRIYDDGDATFLNWPAGSPVPAILITNDEGVEGPVNYAVRGDTVVVDGVPAEIILRSGRDSATLTNQQPGDPHQASKADAALASAGETK